MLDADRMMSGVSPVGLLSTEILKTLDDDVAVERIQRPQ
jgi:hypothetical protein